METIHGVLDGVDHKPVADLWKDDEATGEE